MTDPKRQSRATITLPTEYPAPSIEAVRAYLESRGFVEDNGDFEKDGTTYVIRQDALSDLIECFILHESRPAADILADIAKCEPGYNSWDEGLHPESREAAVRKAYAEGYACARLDPHGTETPKTRLVKHVDCDRDGFGTTSGGADTYISETGRHVPLDRATQPDIATEKTGASTDVHERKYPHDWYMRGSCTCGLGLDVKPAPKALNTVLNEARKDFESLPKSVQEQANRNRERRQAEDALEFGEPAPKAKRPAYYVIRRTVTFVREDGLTSRERLYVHENPSDLATTSRPRAARFSLASTARDYRASLNESWSKDARIVRVVARKKGRGA